ncbi:type IV secretory system conjugative DNA transfer family protein [Novispirillum itersonii]|uniref:Type IV secretion system protein VirD4 n=1 Tax=Novispirillum itersonii TaxID=189 RepID=A0A7W9ZJ32_NOVIT|nr:type IV secretory system conjugative DNA transfer family protein [Novispirillum itersonii]MBB6212421.1 type IV secretion system protein VirD4 [Novispirillum itersonii]
MIMDRILERAVFIAVILSSWAALLGLWWAQIGFDPSDIKWWKWLIASLNHPAGLPQPMVWAAWGCLAGGLVLLIIAMAVMRQARNRTVSGGFKSNELHGTARWATHKDVKKSGLLSKKAQTGAVVGGWIQGKTHHQLRHIGPEHVLCFAPTRSGKGVSLILPTLLSWTDSVLVLDIKGENYALTAGWRAKLGHRILKFDPASQTGCARYNPLAEIRLGTGREIADCQNIAGIIVDPEGTGLKDFWMKEGWAWLSTAILHVVYRVHLTENRKASLADVRAFMSKAPPVETGGSGEDAPDYTAMFAASFESLLVEMLNFDHQNPVINQAVQDGIGNMLKKAQSERSGVHSSAVTGLGLWADPIVAANTGDSDWTVADLMNGTKAAALYLVVPPSDIERLRPLMRIMVTQIVGRLTESMAFADGSSVKGYRHRLLMLLDEFTSIGKVDVLEKAIAFVAGYGIKVYLIVQDIAQLYSVYGKDEGITGNCHVRVAFAPNRPETGEYLSKLAGKTTVIQAKRSRSDKSVSDGVQETARPLLTVDEAMRLPAIREEGDRIIPGDVLTFIAGQNPIRGTQYLYFQDADLLGRAKIPAPTPEDAARQKDATNAAA